MAEKIYHDDFNSVFKNELAPQLIQAGKLITALEEENEQLCSRIKLLEAENEQLKRWCDFTDKVAESYHKPKAALSKEMDNGKSH